MRPARDPRAETAGSDARALRPMPRGRSLRVSAAETGPIAAVPYLRTQSSTASRHRTLAATAGDVDSLRFLRVAVASETTGHRFQQYGRTRDGTGRGQYCRVRQLLPPLRFSLEPAPALSLGPGAHFVHG